MIHIEQLTEDQIIQLHELYLHEWWSDSRTLNETKSCVEGSQIIIGLTDSEENLIGFIRVLTDYIFKALLFDVIVHKKHRNEGIGNKLINLVKSHQKLQKVKHFELYCVPELFEFYKKYGFSQEVGPIQLMRLKNA